MALPNQLNYGKVQNIIGNLCSRCKFLVEELIDNYEHKLYIVNSGRASMASEFQLCDRESLAVIEQKDQEILYWRKCAEDKEPPDKRLQSELEFLTRRLHVEQQEFWQRQEELVKRYEEELEQFRQALSKQFAENEVLKERNSALVFEVDSLNVTRADEFKRMREEEAAEEEAQSSILALHGTVAEQARTIADYEAEKMQFAEASRILLEHSEYTQQLKRLETQCEEEQIRSTSLEIKLEQVSELNEELQDANKRVRTQCAELRAELGIFAQPDLVEPAQACQNAAASNIVMQAFCEDAAEFVYDFGAKSEENVEFLEFLTQNKPEPYRINFELLEQLPRFCYEPVFRQIRFNLLRREALLELGVPRIVAEAFNGRNKRLKSAIFAFLATREDTSSFVDLEAYARYVNQDCKDEFVRIFLHEYELVEEDSGMYFVKGSEKKII